MANIDIDIPHQLSQEEALGRIRNLLTETKKQHGDMVENLSEQWNGNTGHFSFTVKGFDIEGTLSVTPAVVELRSKVPFAVSLFKGTISSLVTEKAKELLS
jgi:hypothetical protein